MYGTYIHGVFDRSEIASEIVRALADRKGAMIRESTVSDYREFKQKEYDRLAEVLRGSLDMDRIYGMLREASI